jgi:hypothetical protein
MAAIVDYVEDIEIHTTSEGTEIVREKGISADSVTDIINGKLLPAYGTRHPDFPQMRLISGSVSRTGNDGGKWQGWWRGTYSSKSTVEEKQADVDPWELDAQEYSCEPFAIEIPMLGGYDKKGNYHRLVNSAGCMLQRQQTVYGEAHKFIYCVKDKGNRPEFDRKAVVNSSSCTIAGERFAAYTAMLLPPSVASRVEYNDDGTVKRSYWEISVEIRVHPISWETETLNVGTMARFKDANGNIDKTPKPIYQYTPWTEKDDDKKFGAKPVYGSLMDVAKAKHEYAKLVSGGTKNDTYYQAYKELPWEEVTDPLPLRLDGTVYEEAMTDPDNNQYYVVALYDSLLGNLGQYGFPKKRER